MYITSLPFVCWTHTVCLLNAQIIEDRCLFAPNFFVFHSLRQFYYSCHLHRAYPCAVPSWTPDSSFLSSLLLTLDLKIQQLPIFLPWNTLNHSSRTQKNHRAIWNPLCGPSARDWLIFVAVVLELSKERCSFKLRCQTIGFSVQCVNNNAQTQNLTFPSTNRGAGTAEILPPVSCMSSDLVTVSSPLLSIRELDSHTSKSLHNLRLQRKPCSHYFK